ncbi:MAG: hypothetical protein K0U74_04335 [Alphaproteobacteria bacterium]|nr:hypothetical protein [Alphaproteobacteria bacterium]
MLKTFTSALALAIVAALSLPTSGIVAGSTAEAHSGYHKRDKAKSYRARKIKRSRRNNGHYYIRRRGGPVFAHEVDLSRPGGPQKFFDLIDEESAR